MARLLGAAVPFVALTATATPNCAEDVKKSLKLKPSCECFQQSFNRPNLRYRIVPKAKGRTDDGADAAMAQLLEYVRGWADGTAGIVYCLSRADCEAAAAALVDGGVRAGVYHAGLTPAQRQRAQRAWQRPGDAAGGISLRPRGVGVFGHDTPSRRPWRRGGRLASRSRAGGRWCAEPARPLSDEPAT